MSIQGMPQPNDLFSFSIYFSVYTHIIPSNAINSVASWNKWSSRQSTLQFESLWEKVLNHLSLNCLASDLLTHFNLVRCKSAFENKNDRVFKSSFFECPSNHSLTGGNSPTANRKHLGQAFFRPRQKNSTLKKLKTQGKNSKFKPKTQGFSKSGKN